MCLDLDMYGIKKMYMREFYDEVANDGDSFTNISVYEQYRILGRLNAM